MTMAAIFALADSGQAVVSAHGGDVPQSAVSNRSKTVFLLDDLVGGHLHDQRYSEAERLRRFEIDDEFDLGRLHYGKLGGLLTLEDAINVSRSAAANPAP